MRVGLGDGDDELRVVFVSRYLTARRSGPAQPLREIPVCFVRINFFKEFHLDLWFVGLQIESCPPTTRSRKVIKVSGPYLAWLKRNWGSGHQESPPHKPQSKPALRSSY